MGKVWIVTGSSRGLGRELAKAVLASGDRLVATARDPRTLDGVVAEHRERAIAVGVDVTRAEDARRAVGEALERFGRVDVLVNNAGYANTAAIEDVEESDFRAQLETNFFGVFHMTRAVLPAMRGQKGGHVIQISSVGGRLGTPGLGAYQSAKWAVEGFTEVLAREVAPLGIKATLVEPGGLRTDWAGSSMRIDEPSEPYRATLGAIAGHARQQATARGDPAKAAQAIVHIASLSEPPLRLLLGTDAVFLAELVAKRRAAEDVRWKDLSITTDFTGAVPFHETAFAKVLQGDMTVTDRDSIPVSHTVLARLGALGVPIDRVLRRAGLEMDEPLHPARATVTTAEFFAFWLAVDQETQRRDVGLLLGTEAPERGYSVASAAALHAPNLEEALKTLARYKRLTCPEHIELEVRGGEASVRFDWILATMQVPRLLVDSTFASFVALARRGTGGKAAPVRIELARRGADGALLRAHFGCRVVFGAPVDQIVFAERALATPFATADAEAYSRVVPGLEAELVGRSRSRSLRDEVRVTIARNMSSGARPSVDRVARKLHLSPRTLQRRLGDERTSYQEQLDEVRRTSARRLLANTGLDTVEIAFLLGFEEPNSFARAFRAWERMTPVRWRRRAARP